MCTVWLSHMSKSCSHDLEGHSCGQLVIGSFSMTTNTLRHRVSCSFLFAKHQITPVTQPPYSPDLVPCDFWLFPKLKSPLKGKRFQTIDEIQENMKGQLADEDWENCVRSQDAYFEGDWVIIVLCTMFLISCIFLNKCLYFSQYMAGYLLNRPCIFNKWLIFLSPTEDHTHHPHLFLSTQRKNPILSEMHSEPWLLPAFHAPTLLF